MANDRTHAKKKREALKASNNGKCWWVYQWIMSNTWTPNENNQTKRRR